MTDHAAKLREAIATKSAIVLVGTGGSRSLTGNAAAADWIGLIRDGVEAARQKMGADAWATQVSGILDFATDQSDTSMLINAASMVQSKLREAGEQAYSDWLRESVGELCVTDSTLARALRHTGAPILTTNYDDLLEQALDVPTFTWQDRERMRDVMQGKPGVGHLHGHWMTPASVILSDADYERVIGEDPAQHLQSSYYVAKSFVFVGYGSGLEDPNFGRLLKLHRALYPDSRHDHYRLARSSEAAALERLHAGDNIRIITYGDDHADLAPFIFGLQEAHENELTRGDYVSFATEAILDQLRADTVLGDQLPDIDERPLNEMIVPPVLLPMPHDQFAANQKQDEGIRPKRHDLEEIFSRSKIYILAGEEGAGVTTAIRWLATHAASAHRGVAPLYVDARRCRSKQHALDIEVRNEALANRLIDGRKHPLPDHLLAIDNVKSADSRAHLSLIEDLLSSNAKVIFIGARQGDENDLYESLLGAALPIEVLYLGKPGRVEAEALANIIAPESGRALVSQVLEVLRREHLQRTPFNICLLIVLLSRGPGGTANASDTAVLDRYVQLLLGRTGNFIDPRWTLDPQNRETVLSELAKTMVRERRGSLTRTQAISEVEEYFGRVSWPEDPIETLDSFGRMRLLRVRHESVSFQQSSYLHLFAAKAAISDETFLDELLANPLYFAPIIRHYAALVRNSARVASELLGALERDWPSSPPVSSAYESLGEALAPELSDSVSADEVDDDDPDTTEPSAQQAEADLQDYDGSDDKDAVPFPLDDPTEWSETRQMMWALDLSSRVVRDSDTLENLDLKRNLLHTVLDRWGYLLDLMVRDNYFDEVANGVVDLAVESGDIEPDKTEEARAEFLRTWPAFCVLGGISATLSSRKLLMTLDHLASGDPEPSLYNDVATSLLAIDLSNAGWAKHLPSVAERNARVWVVADFVYPILRLIYRIQRLTPEDDESLRAFFKAYFERRFKFESTAHRNRWVGETMKELNLERLRFQNKRLDEGVRAIEALTDNDES